MFSPETGRYHVGLSGNMTVEHSERLMSTTNEPLTIPATVCPESHSADSGVVKIDGATREEKT